MWRIIAGLHCGLLLFLWLTLLIRLTLLLRGLQLLFLLLVSALLVRALFLAPRVLPIGVLLLVLLVGVVLLLLVVGLLFLVLRLHVSALFRWLTLRSRLSYTASFHGPRRRRRRAKGSRRLAADAAPSAAEHSWLCGGGARRTCSTQYVARLRTLWRSRVGTRRFMLSRAYPHGRRGLGPRLANPWAQRSKPNKLLCLRRVAR